jgi:acyl dehydratase
VTQDTKLPLESFEDFEVGQQVVSPSHTVTEDEVLTFARLSGDHNPLHVDRDFAERGPFGRRVAHGLLTLAITSGLATQLGLIGESVLAFRELSCKFRQPVFIGDSVHVQLTIVETRRMPRIGGGLVRIDVKLYNQDDRITSSGVWTLLVQSTSGQAAPE